MRSHIYGKLTVVALLLSLLVSSCKKDEEDEPTPEEKLQQTLANVDQVQLATDIEIIEDSLAKWSINPLIEPNGVRYEIKTQGTGAKPTLSSVITLNYRGRILKTNSVFDQATGAKFYLSGLIAGWQTTLPLINAGSKIVLYIPSGLAYGTRDVLGSNNQTVIIPKNSNLIFEIDLVAVQ